MFQPWLTDSWGRPDNALGGVKLMVLGESHYGEDLDANFTRWLIERHVGGTPEPLLSKVETLLQPQVPSLNMGSGGDRNALWSSMVFWNFVPVTVGPNRKYRPTSAMWNAGRTEFRRKLEEHQPEAVLVLGKTLWHEMPWSDEQPAPTFNLRGKPEPFRRYRLQAGADESAYAAAAFVNHPTGSHGWKVSDWLDVSAHLFAEARRERPEA